MLTISLDNVDISAFSGNGFFHTMTLFMIIYSLNDFEIMEICQTNNV